METIVNGCRDCKFYNDGVRYEYAYYCNHPQSPQEVNNFTAEPEIELVTVQEKTKEKDGYDYMAKYPITPNWCPLKKEPITISIKQVKHGAD